MRLIVLLAWFALMVLPSCQPSPELPDAERQAAPSSPDGLETELERPVETDPDKPAESGPTTTREYVQQGYDLLLVGKEREAQQALQAALRRSPNHRQATMLMEQINADPVAVLGSDSFPYRIRRKDSLIGLAKRFLNDPFKFYLLAKYNGLSNPSRIRVGQVIQIPGQDPDASPPPPPTPVAETPTPPPAEAPPVVVEPAESTDTTPPQIELQEPAALRDVPHMTVTEDMINLSGTVTDPAGLFVFAVNGNAVEVDADGRFQYALRLSPSENVVRLTAVDNHRNEAESTYRIRFDPPKPKPTVAEAPPVPAFGRYHALVIGINTYAHLPKLSTPVTDTAAITRLLKDQYGFNVTFLPDARSTDIIQVLENFRSILTPQDNFLVYFAGHGRLDEAGEHGYWLPLDAELKSREQWLSTAAISDTINAMAAKHVIVIADSVFTGTRARNGNPDTMPATADERQQYVERMSHKRSRTAMTSGGLKPVLDSGGGRHSLFAKALLTVLYTNGEILEGERLFTKMRPWIAISSEQTPEYADIRSPKHEGGDFLFVPAAQSVR